LSKDLLRESVAVVEIDGTLSIVVDSFVKGGQPLSLVFSEWRQLPRYTLPARGLSRNI
jgi:hypothetical protein